MTESASPLSLAFLATHPDDAARVMETLEPAELAAFVMQVPVRLAADPLASLSPWRAGRCLAALEPSHASALVAEMPADRRALCLRAVPDRARGAILDALPRRKARGIRRQLDYPLGVVGATMAGDFVSVGLAATVADAREAVRAIGAGAITQVYVVRDSGRLATVVPLAALLDASAERPVRELGHRDFEAISAEAPIGQVATDRGWSTSAERPVVDSRQRLVGVITLGRILAGRTPAGGAVTQGRSAASVLAHAYVGTLSGLYHAAGALIPGAGGSGDAR